MVDTQWWNTPSQDIQKNPDKSELWFELAEVLRLGGTFNKKKTAFTAPYVFSRFPNSFDSYSYGAITDKNVNIRSKPTLKSKVIAKLSYTELILNCPKLAWVDYMKLFPH